MKTPLKLHMDTQDDQVILDADGKVLACIWDHETPLGKEAAALFAAAPAMRDALRLIHEHATSTVGDGMDSGWVADTASDALTLAGVVVNRVHLNPTRIVDGKVTPRVAACCSECGGKNVTREATATRWDEDRQEWVITGMGDDAYCDDCESEVDIDEVPL